MPHKLIATILFVIALNGVLAKATEPTDAITIRLVRPDRQLERLIGLFEGARVSDPAAAMAAWKRAARDRGNHSKAVEAVLAALNPGMVRELRNVHEAQIGLGLDPEDGRTRWFVVAPHDDGALAALTTAMTLTDGGSDAPYQALEVDRLGRPGSPLALKVPGQLALVGSRGDLPAAFEATRAPADAPSRREAMTERSGWMIRLDPEALPATGPVSNRRLAEALQGAGLRRLDGTLGLEGETIQVDLTGDFREPLGNPAIDPAWLDWVPASGVAAALVIAIDSSPLAWDARFAWADRVEHADPANGPLAPLRTRLTLLSIAAGIQPEVDLFPQLRGLSAFLLSPRAGEQEAEAVVVALHVANPDAAARLATHLVPRAAASFLKGTSADEPVDGVRRLGRVSGRPLEVVQQGSTVLIGWGQNALQAGLAAGREPERSAGALLRSVWGDATPPQRLGLVWPGRLGSPLLADAHPVIWIGRNVTEGKPARTRTRDIVRWTELRGVVRRLLDRLPLEPTFNP